MHRPGYDYDPDCPVCQELDREARERDEAKARKRHAIVARLRAEGGIPSSITDEVVAATFEGSLTWAMAGVAVARDQFVDAIKELLHL